MCKNHNIVYNIEYSLYVIYDKLKVLAFPSEKPQLHECATLTLGLSLCSDSTRLLESRNMHLSLQRHVDPKCVNHTKADFIKM